MLQRIGSMKMHKRRWLIGGAVLLLPTLAGTLFAWSQGASLRAWRLLGQHNIDTILHHNRVETYRISAGAYRVSTRPVSSKMIAGYPVIGISKK